MSETPTPALLFPSDDQLKLIAKKVRVDCEFRQKIGGSSLVPSFDQEFCFWRNYRDDPTKRLVLAYTGSRIIGFFGLDEVNPVARNARAHVHFWDIDRSFRKLCDMFLDHCRHEQGLDRLWGMTNQTNEKAVKFAQKIGFEIVGFLPNHYRTLNGFSSAVITNLELFESKK